MIERIIELGLLKCGIVERFDKVVNDYKCINAHVVVLQETSQRSLSCVRYFHRAPINCI